MTNRVTLTGGDRAQELCQVLKIFVLKVKNKL